MIMLNSLKLLQQFIPSFDSSSTRECIDRSDTKTRFPRIADETIGASGVNKKFDAERACGYGPLRGDERQKNTHSRITNADNNDNFLDKMLYDHLGSVNTSTRGDTRVTKKNVISVPMRQNITSKRDTEIRSQATMNKNSQNDMSVFNDWISSAENDKTKRGKKKKRSSSNEDEESNNHGWDSQDIKTQIDTSKRRESKALATNQKEGKSKDKRTHDTTNSNNESNKERNDTKKDRKETSEDKLNEIIEMLNSEEVSSDKYPSIDILDIEKIEELVVFDNADTIDIFDKNNPYDPSSDADVDKYVVDYDGLDDNEVDDNNRDDDI